MIIIDFPLNGTMKSTVVNEGSLSTGPTISLMFVASASYIELTTDQTSDIIRFDYPFVSGDSLTIFCEEQYATLNGPTNMMPYLDLSSRFFKLAPGDNVFTITPQRTAYMVVEYREKWI